MMACLHAGASLVELYTGLAYGGPALISRIKRELAALLHRDGFACVGDAVGADHSAVSDSTSILVYRADTPCVAGCPWWLML